MTITSPATRTEFAAIERLLSGAGLPTAGVGACLENFFVRLNQGSVVGCVGLELCGEAALLRSLAVHETYRGRGESPILIQAAERHAIQRGVRDIYLLTMTAEGLFERLGYRRIPRDTAPLGILATEEFRHMCPAPAACMWRSLALGA